MFIKPDKLDLAPNELVQIVNAIYGLCDPGDYWSKTISSHYKKDLKLQSSDFDRPLVLKR